jgi:hypothetical protein
MSHSHSKDRAHGRYSSQFCDGSSLSHLTETSFDLGKPTYDTTVDTRAVPRNIKMDANGRLIDEKGNVIELTSNKSFKINKKNEKRTTMKPLRSIQRKAQLDQIKLKKSQFFDPDLEAVSGNKRNKRKIMGLHFFEQGTHIK